MKSVLDLPGFLRHRQHGDEVDVIVTRDVNDETLKVKLAGLPQKRQSRFRPLHNERVSREEANANSDAQVPHVKNCPVIRTTGGVGDWCRRLLTLLESTSVVLACFSGILP